MMVSCKITVFSPLFHSVFGGFVVASTTFGCLVLYLHERKFGA
jgi:hypothetical protein